MRRIIFIIVIIFITIINIILTQPTAAQTSSCGAGTQRASGLVSTPILIPGSNFNTSGGCLIDTKASFIPFKIPTYLDLKSLYFDQSKLPGAGSGVTQRKFANPAGDKDQSYFTAANFNPSPPNPYTIHYIPGNLNIIPTTASCDGGSCNTIYPTFKPAIVFVDGNLNFYGAGGVLPKKFSYGGNDYGIVFVVAGNINIHQNFTQIDAVLIAGGKICTAIDTGAWPDPSNTNPTCPSGFTTPLGTSWKLTVNGSLISLDSTKPISFRRTLTDNNQPAEVVNSQPKYLVILRDILSETLQKWTEVTGNDPLPTPPAGGSQPTPSPTPAATPPPPQTEALIIKSTTLPSARYFLSCAENSPTNIISCFGGAQAPTSLNPTGNLDEIVEYNPASGTGGSIATKSVSLLTKRYGLSCAGNPPTSSLYCFGGYDNTSYLNQILEHSPSGNTVTPKTTNLSPGRYLHSCVRSGNGNIYCFGGFDGALGYLNQIVEYIPNSTISTKSTTLPTARIYSPCVENSSTTSRKIYCFGGFDGTYLDQIVEYDPATDTRNIKNATLPTKMYAHSCAENSATHKIYCFGGYDGVNFLRNIIEYDPVSDTVTTRPILLPTARGYFSCAENSSTHKIYCFGGYDTTVGYLDQITEYTPPPPPVPCANLPSGLVSYWKMDEASGTNVEDAIGTNSGTAYTTSIVAGKLGNARSFNGAAGSRVDMGDKASLELTIFTISGWINRSGNCAYSVCPILSKGQSGNIGYSLETGTSYRAVLNIRDSLQAIQSTTTLNTGTWYHVVGTVSGSNLSLYVNGALEASAAQTQTPTYGAEPARIGNRNTNNDIPMNGVIDEVGIWNRVLSAGEIASLYNGGNGLTCSSGGAPPPTPTPTPAPTPTPTPASCPTGYRDEDLDTFTMGGPQSVCPGPSLPSGWRSSPSAQPDCYDQSALAKPTQTGYFTSPRADGSLDWNCSGVEERQYGGALGPLVECSPTASAPWICYLSCSNTCNDSSSVPCGTYGDYATSCSPRTVTGLASDLTSCDGDAFSGYVLQYSNYLGCH